MLSRCTIGNTRVLESSARKRELDNDKGGQRRVDSFELWCWRRLQKISWTEKVPNGVVLAIASPPNVSGGDGAQIKAVLLWTYNESQWYGEIHYVGKDRGHETARQAADQVDGWSDVGDGKRIG